MVANRISVIVPVYNVAAVLPTCLDSILAQTYTDLEIIAVDDGSLDDSGKILDRYSTENGNLRVIHKENGGVTSARLRGIQEATGEWIGFVDGDDEIEPDMFERLLNNARKYDAQISHCGYQMRFSDGRIHYFHNTGKLIKQDKVAAIRELLSGVMIEPGLWNKLFHVKLFHGFLHDGIMDQSIKNNEDLLMNFYLFSEADTSVFQDWCPYHYIVREGSASRGKLSKHKIFDPIKVKQIILEKCDCRNLIDAQKAFLETCVHTYCGLLTNPEMRDCRYEVRKEIISHKEWIAHLSSRTKILARLSVHAPVLLAISYPVYEKYFQIRKYE